MLKPSLMGRKNSAFTIVELLIVVVVIAVLASIVVVSYSGIQQSAEDTVRRDMASKIKKAYELWMTETGNTPYGLPCGHNDNGLGFLQFTHGASGPYAGKTCIDLLSEAGYLSAAFNTGPANTAYDNLKDRSYMIFRCSRGDAQNKAFLLWHVQSPTEEETSRYQSESARCVTSGQPYYEYGMRTGVLLVW